MSRRLRVLVGGIFHESHSFLAGEMTREQCSRLQGAALLAVRGDASPLGSGLATGHELGWEMIAGSDLRATPGPPIEHAVFEEWMQAWDAALVQAMQSGLDGVYLVLHGAMLTRQCLDVEGAVLQATRSRVGPGIPIGGPTDLHANFSKLMAQSSDGLITYRENPHIDAAATAQRAAHLLDRLMRAAQNAPAGVRRAHTAFASAPIVWAPTGTGTASSPMRDLEALARLHENHDPALFVVNVHAGYSYADTPFTGLSFSAISDGSERGRAAADSALTKLGDLAWQLRAEGVAPEMPLDEALDHVESLLREEPPAHDGPIVLVEPADNIGGGAPGDATHLLRALLERGIGGVGAIIDDPAAVAALRNCEVGQRAAVAIGGKSGSLGGAPLDLDVEVIAHSDGNFDLEDANSHLASMSGTHIQMGSCVTVRSSGAVILLTSRPTPPFDLGQWRSQGVTPESLKVVAVKAAVAHRRAYDPIARTSFTVATPGACTGDLPSLPYQHLRRPVYPFDKEI